jgi:hypothetical protein
MFDQRGVEFFVHPCLAQKPLLLFPLQSCFAVEEGFQVLLILEKQVVDEILDLPCGDLLLLGSRDADI